MNIGEAASKSGLSVKMIRHYEKIGVLPKSRRTEAGYRNFSAEDIHTLVFVSKSRQLGFSMLEIKKLVSIWNNKNRSSSEVKAIVIKHIAALDIKIENLLLMQKALSGLVKQCRGDHRPECPILDTLKRK